MIRDDPYWAASLAAEKVVKEHDIATLPVDPIALARSLGIEIRAKPTHTQGVSGMLLRLRQQVRNCLRDPHRQTSDSRTSASRTNSGTTSCLATSMPCSLTAIFMNRALDLLSGIRYEMEADHFAASLLMPRLLFTEAMRTSGDGLTAIKKLASLCRTSLTATGIRYVQWLP